MMDNETVTAENYYPENGRTYHALEREAFYPFPNDAEAHSLDAERHEIYLMLFEGKLHLAKLSSPQRVLDLGSGCGRWMNDFAKVHPSAIITAIDLSPPSIRSAPNTTYKLVDFETPKAWELEDSLDYIHARDLFGSIDQPEWLLKRCYDSLSPNGCFEYQDFGLPMTIEGTMDQTSALGRWEHFCHKALTQIRRCPQLSKEIAPKMQATGFVSIAVTTTKLPLGDWHREPHLRSIGIKARDNFLYGLFSIWTRRILSENVHPVFEAFMECARLKGSFGSGEE